MSSGRWRIVAVYRGDAADPYEQYVWHNAGMGGFGESSHIDALVLRDRDADLDENAVLEERLYYCQSWRADVVAVVDSTGTLVEGARYSAYGVPIGVPAGDTNSDLAFDSTDSTNITGWSPPASYDVRYDVNLDGAITSADASAAATVTLGRGVLSSAAVDNRRRYAGYEFWPAPAANLYSVRYRVLHSDLGRWTWRDPLGYVDGMSLYSYVQALVLLATDAFGLGDDDHGTGIPDPNFKPWCGVDQVIAAAGIGLARIPPCIPTDDDGDWWTPIPRQPPWTPGPPGSPPPITDPQWQDCTSACLYVGALWRWACLSCTAKNRASITTCIKVADQALKASLAACLSDDASLTAPSIMWKAMCSALKKCKAGFRCGTRLPPGVIPPGYPGVPPQKRSPQCWRSVGDDAHSSAHAYSNSGCISKWACVAI